ncbi:uncharacterized protein EI90DRAFT_3061143 [Cantharellus anzutake]|uniref:uncharacterized protein n=1 Tax=Cantharellus anzutake TaxID=1750568 RepID=UPI001905DCD8|nr:uncharacterized protein EI90DRAFT_3061143 [Cantharellus anzutake]KAF8329981.1 hypothetical protein EI90DRAFT_3061143 [Cantharellus anzutake]
MKEKFGQQGLWLSSTYGSCRSPNSRAKWAFFALLSAFTHRGWALMRDPIVSWLHSGTGSKGMAITKKTQDLAGSRSMYQRVRIRESL